MTSGIFSHSYAFVDIEIVPEINDDGVGGFDGIKLIFKCSDCGEDDTIEFDRENAVKLFNRSLHVGIQIAKEIQ